MSIILVPLPWVSVYFYRVTKETRWSNERGFKRGRIIVKFVIREGGEIDLFFLKIKNCLNTVEKFIPFDKNRNLERNTVLSIKPKFRN